MIYRCATCRKMQYFKKYNLVEFIQDKDYELVKQRLKICDPCADVLEDLKNSENMKQE